MRGCFRRRPEQFLLLTSPRSGSNHLISLLRQHPAVQGFYELFHEDPAVRARWKGTTYQESESVALFLDRVLDHPYHPFTRAVGFKLFYGQAQHSPLSEVWPYLASRQNLKIIELFRRNRFHQFVSLEVARLTWIWDERKDLPAEKRPKYPTLEISAERFLEYLYEQEQLRARAVEKFPDSERLEVWYEDLCHQRSKTLSKIFSFLNAPRIPFIWTVRDELEKQRRATIPEQVTNYYDLKSHFAGSEYAKYFVH